MSDSADFVRLLEAIGRGGDDIRLASGDANSFSAQRVPAADVPDLQFSTALNYWFEINPSTYQLPAGRSKADDIKALTTLWADLDFKPAPEGMGSPDAAYDVISELSAALGLQPAAIVHSGHGFQPYWPLERVDIFEDNRNEVATFLKRWGAFVKQAAASNHGAADSVYDLPRIFRVPGPANIKDPTHPVPTAVHFFDVPLLTMAEVSAMLDDYGVSVDSVEVSAEIVSAAGEWEWAQSECRFARVAYTEITSSKPASRHHWGLKWAAILHGMIRNGCLTEQGFYRLRDALESQFKVLLQREGSTRPYNPIEMRGILKAGQQKAESWSPSKLAEEMRQHPHEDDFSWMRDTPQPIVEPSATVTSIFTGRTLNSETPTVGTLALAPSIVTSQRMMNVAHTDVGNAERLAQWVRGRFIFVPAIGWMEWVGGQYRPDVRGRIVEEAKNCFVQMLSTSNREADSKWAYNSMSRGKMSAMTSLAQSVDHIAVTTEMLDADGYVVNTPGGIVDLRTSEIRPADPQVDYHSLMTGFTPEPMATPRFDAFLQWAMAESPLEAEDEWSRVKYLQRLFGAAIIGDLLYHISPLFLGSGANGKTTILQLLVGAFGSYAKVMPQKFLVQKNGDSHPTEIANLRGVRLAAMSEVPPNAKFDEDLLKTISGEPILTGRFMGENFFSFHNTVTGFLAANHAPTVQVGGPGFWRRMRRIQFTQSLPLNLQNERFVPELLAAEGPGILQWAIDGARIVMQRGLMDPRSVIAATREYELEEDMLQQFFESNLMIVPGARISRDTIYTTYSRWAQRQGIEKPDSRVRFIRSILQQYPTLGEGADKTVFANVVVIAPTMADRLDQ